MAKGNAEKYNTYKNLFDDLKKSFENGFYYEAIFIEYAIFEDRFSSVIKYSGQSITDKSGRPLKLSKKIDILKSKSPFTSKYVRERVSLELLENINSWKKERDLLIHDLANKPYQDDNSKQIAEQGNDLVNIFNNKSKSVISYLKKNLSIVQNEV